MSFKLLELKMVIITFAVYEIAMYCVHIPFSLMLGHALAQSKITWQELTIFFCLYRDSIINGIILLAAV